MPVMRVVRRAVFSRVCIPAEHKVCMFWASHIM